MSHATTQERPAWLADAVADMLQRTRVERGLPLKIDDPAIIAKVAAIVTAGGEAR